MNEIRITTGVGLDRHGNAIKPDVALSDIESQLLKQFGGFTRIDGRGAWRQCQECPTQKEPSVTYEILTDESEQQGRAAAVFIRDMLRQDTVLFAFTPDVKAKFI